MEKVLVTVSQAAVSEAELAIDGCYRCSIRAKVPFSRVLHSFRRYRENVEYILPILAHCPKCLGEVDEKTIVTFKESLPTSQRR